MSLEGKILLNRYRVDEFLGRGGMAEVYKVWDAHRSTTLAIKVMHADFSLDRAFLRRFEREAQILARLQHPNIVRFYGLEQDGRQSFMVMDYIDGESLKHKIFDANGPMPLDQVLSVLRPLCQALQYAHNEGFVHADIKPANILMDRFGNIMLTDFGISRMTTTATATLTMAGAGTPAYMSPEQAQQKTPTPKSDIYALGIVAFEMLTGQRPFSGEYARVGVSTSEKMRWEHINLKVPSPKQFNHTLPEKLSAAVLKALEKDPEKRQKSALVFLNTIERGKGSTREKSNGEVAQKAIHNNVKKRNGETQAPPKKKGLRKEIFTLLLAGMFFVAVIGILLFLPKQPTAMPILMETQTSTMTEIPPSETPTITPRPSSTFTPSMTPTETLTPTSTAFPLEISDIDAKGNLIPMQLVPAGEFTMGSIYGENDEEPPHAVLLDDFYMDKYEVTNRLYKTCVQAGVCKQPDSTIKYDDDAYKDHPVISVDWYQAKAYCEWRGADLPDEAEWEKAARGDDGRPYPWGRDLDCTQANYSACFYGVLDNPDNKRYNDTLPVGSFDTGVSPYGIYDMAGNAPEWTNDWYSPYPGNTFFAGDFGNVYRVIRGGSYWISKNGLRTSTRFRETPNSKAGFRCARDAGTGNTTTIMPSETPTAIPSPTKVNTETPSPQPTEVVVHDTSPPVFDYPLNGQTLGCDSNGSTGSLLFRVLPIDHADWYQWSFFQNGELVWENYRDEGFFSPNEYGIHEDGVAHTRLSCGNMDVVVRASIDGTWTNAVVITVVLVEGN